MRLLIVDNYDSFTFNLVELCRQVAGVEPTVVPNDTPWASVDPGAFDAALISPGPGHPANPQDVGMSARLLDEFAGPILGVCLGFQLMVTHAGGRVERAQRPAHGESAAIAHGGTGLFAGLPNPATAVRYHSLVATELPARFRVTATHSDALTGQEIPMAIADTQAPRWGVQFHPESYLSECGRAIIANFLSLARAWWAQDYFCVRTLPHAAEPSNVMRALGTRSFWLDSGDFTILGDDSGPGAEYISHDRASARADFFDELQERLAARRLPERAGSPIPGCDFALGWVGYLGYELGVPHAAAQLATPAGVPDAEFIFCTRAIVIDRARGVTHLLSLAGDDAWELDDAVFSAPPQPAAGPAARQESQEPTWVHNHDAYLERIAAAQELMRAGESYEVCLTNRVELDPAARAALFADPVATFERLRDANPSGRTALLNFPGQQLLSTSPELFLAVDAAGAVHSRPIKGTRPRGATLQEDAALKEELRGDKERAELLMVVDMVRHDLSRVCSTVAVTAPFVIESYATVHQLMCHIEGPLAPGRTAVDALRAAFPGGSMTGAPKHRTMQIISELEGTWRGAYSGTYGYLSLTGTADFSMTIRTLVNRRGSSAGAADGADGADGDSGLAYYGVGGAILVRSDAEAEWEETQVKARPLTRLLGLADEH